MINDRENRKRSERNPSQYHAWHNFYMKLHIGDENPINNRLNCSPSSEAKLKALSARYESNEVSTGLFLLSP